MPDDRDEADASLQAQSDATKSYPSRRVVIGAAVGAALIGGAAAITLPRILTPSPGKLVGALLATKDFTVAHRGGSLDWPEMSLEGYVKSVGYGVNALEMSLARSSDGVWFGLHDATLDRTSGTSGFVAAEHTWSEISKYRITAKDTRKPNQLPRRYLKFTDLVRRYGSTHTIFVDPKYVLSEHWSELLTMMRNSVEKPKSTFIAKFYCTGSNWATLAREHGYLSWGYYYGTEVDADPTLLPRTQQYWDLLGMDYTASDSAWTSVRGFHKKVIGHIIPDKAAAQRTINLGVAGNMISGVAEVLA
jgi:glycerophosphoryl diester phosphodiesterase